MRKTVFSILCLEGAVLSFNVAAAPALIPSISKEFGISQFFTGHIIWLYMVPYGIAALLYGPLSRRIDPKKIELVCFSFFSLSNLLAAFARNIYLFFCARFLMGVFGASVIPLVLILISRYADPGERGKLVGIFFSATFIASLLGLSLSAVIPWRLIFFIPAAFGLLLLIHMWMYLPGFKETGVQPAVNYRAALKNRKIALIFSYIFSVSFLYHGVQQWLAVYFSSALQLNQFLISVLLTLTSFSGIFGEIAGGWCSDRAGRETTAGFGISLMVIAVFLLTVGLPLWALAVIMVIWGFGWTLNHAGLSTMLTDLPKDLVHEAAGLNSSVRFISGGLGVMAGGILMPRGFQRGFAVFGCGLIVLSFVARRYLMKTKGGYNDQFKG
ncbi:MAG: MFS transporter [Candidatus Omnitrophota bacterium]